MPVSFFVGGEKMRPEGGGSNGRSREKVVYESVGVSSQEPRPYVKSDWLSVILGVGITGRGHIKRISLDTAR